MFAEDGGLRNHALIAGSLRYFQGAEVRVQPSHLLHSGLSLVWTVQGNHNKEHIWIASFLPLVFRACRRQIIAYKSKLCFESRVRLGHMPDDGKPNWTPLPTLYKPDIIISNAVLIEKIPTFHHENNDSPYLFPGVSNEHTF